MKNILFILFYFKAPAYVEINLKRILLEYIKISPDEERQTHTYYIIFSYLISNIFLASCKHLYCSLSIYLIACVNYFIKQVFLGVVL